MSKPIRRKALNFDEYAQLKMYLNKAKTKYECKQLWDSEIGHKFYSQPKKTLYCEVQVPEDYWQEHFARKTNGPGEDPQQTPPPPPDAFQYQ